MTAAGTVPSARLHARPRAHFTPARNWMNDPNGLVYHRGTYHLFFQHNPNGLGHGDISWGHATSADLVSWEEQPLAIPYDENEQIFSGSAVVDHTNSSGFADDGSVAMVAIYTSATRDGTQAQALAYSLDEGQTWQKYAGNPVLDRGSADFRDPKVFRYSGEDGEHWVMVAVEAAEHRVLLYRSDDLKRWTYMSSYGPAGAMGGVWECPDLFPLPVDGDASSRKWVMLVSLNPGGVAGGSGTQYVVGDFDGHTFTADREWPLRGADDPGLADLDWLDWGRDCYAGVTFSGLPEADRTLIAWMSNWDYAHHMPTRPWRGAMTLARKLSLVSAEGRPQLRSSPVLPQAVAVEDHSALAAGAGVALPALARVDVEVGEEVLVDLEFGDGDNSVSVRIDGATGIVQLDRRDAGFDDGAFASVERMTLPDGAAARVTFVLDHGSIEVFAADGLRTLTEVVFLGEERHITLKHVEGGNVTRLQVSDLTDGAAG